MFISKREIDKRETRTEFSNLLRNQKKIKIKKGKIPNKIAIEETATIANILLSNNIFILLSHYITYINSYEFSTI